MVKAEWFDTDWLKSVDVPTNEPKWYQIVPIEESGEPLDSIPFDVFAVETPHPYLTLGAPYGDRSPYYLRRGVIQALLKAQSILQQRHNGWRLKVFDAYRPVAVQRFMVTYTFLYNIAMSGQEPATLSSSERADTFRDVFKFWALPSDKASMPPPHSTGGAIDLTVVDENGIEINMGTPVDELTDRANPNYFLSQIGAEAQHYHANRELLYSCMRGAGFQRHPDEWWHFCFGDQMWATLSNNEGNAPEAVARYGRAE